MVSYARSIFGSLAYIMSALEFSDLGAMVEVDSRKEVVDDEEEHREVGRSNKVRTSSQLRHLARYRIRRLCTRNTSNVVYAGSRRVEVLQSTVLI